MKKQKGYSQIEVLVSVLVLAIGFLGMAGLQTTSLQNAQKSVLRTQAAYLSYEILDRMRANTGVSYASGVGDFPGAVTNCSTSACNTAELKDFDLAQWKCSLGYTDNTCTGNQLSGSLYSVDNALPSGRGKITTDAATGDVTIAIYWLEDRDGNEAFDENNPEPYESFTLTTRI